jgi:hypothetical protein
MHHRDPDRSGLRRRIEAHFPPVPQHQPGIRRNMPATIFMSVDFPAPFSPRSK